VGSRHRVEISAAAERDIRAIRDHVARDNAIAAEKWVAAVSRQIATLASFPLRGAAIAEARFLGAKYRQLIHGSYRTIYRIEGERVLVIRVVHGARQLPLHGASEPASC
jgi:plasmid stabilization system protein ParE